MNAPRCLNVPRGSPFSVRSTRRGLKNGLNGKTVWLDRGVNRVQASVPLRTCRCAVRWS